MFRISLGAIGFGLISLFAPTPLALAQEYTLDTVVVSAQRRAEMPGVVLKRQGDFLLMDLLIESDSRDLETRKQEIEKTVQDLLSLAGKENNISVSLDANGMVYPLQSAQNLPLTGGSRPDTSLAQLVLRTPIPANTDDVQSLATRLKVFAGKIKGIGRATATISGSTTISIVDPDQYRMDLINLILSEVKSVTDQLGPDYRVMIDDLDDRLRWVNADGISVLFYIPYNYRIVPTSMTSIMEAY